MAEHRNIECKVAAVCAMAGAAFLVIGTLLHPVPADPNDAIAAFTEYAADRLWIASHLMQLAGVALILTTLILIVSINRRAGDAILYRVGTAGAIASLTMAAALQAVDGIALRRAINVWFAAPVASREAPFYAALAIRQIEIGLASIFSILLGVTAALFGFAMHRDDAFPNWVAGLAVLGGISSAIAGIVMAYSGFSNLEMLISMPASYVLLLWTLIIGFLLWRAE
jgi:hypothetical protein